MTLAGQLAQTDRRPRCELMGPTGGMGLMTVQTKRAMTSESGTLCLHQAWHESLTCIPSIPSAVLWAEAMCHPKSHSHREAQASSFHLLHPHAYGSHSFPDMLHDFEQFPLLPRPQFPIRQMVRVGLAEISSPPQPSRALTWSMTWEMVRGWPPGPTKGLLPGEGDPRHWLSRRGCLATRLSPLRWFLPGSQISHHCQS